MTFFILCMIAAAIFGYWLQNRRLRAVGINPKIYRKMRRISWKAARDYKRRKAAEFAASQDHR